MKIVKTLIDASVKAVKMNVPSTVGGLAFAGGASIVVAFAQGYAMQAGKELHARVKAAAEEKKRFANCKPVDAQ